MNGGGGTPGPSPGPAAGGIPGPLCGIMPGPLGSGIPGPLVLDKIASGGDIPGPLGGGTPGPDGGPDNKAPTPVPAAAPDNIPGTPGPVGGRTPGPVNRGENTIGGIPSLEGGGSTGDDFRGRANGPGEEVFMDDGGAMGLERFALVGDVGGPERDGDTVSELGD